MNYPSHWICGNCVDFELKNQLVPSPFLISGRLSFCWSSQHFWRIDVSYSGTSSFFVTFSPVSFVFLPYAVYSVYIIWTINAEQVFFWTYKGVFIWSLLAILGGLALLLRLAFIPILHGSLSGGLALVRGPDILTSVTTSFCCGLK